MSSSADLLLALRKLNLLESRPKFWWPDVGTFKMVISAILTQNSRWESVERSLKNLEPFLELDRFLELDINSLASLIKPSGFYNQKANRLLKLARNIKEEFGEFEIFQKEVSREWLLNQKGIGFESADAILCYGCFREVMVVDSYSARLLKRFGYEFEGYEELQEWFMEGVIGSWDEIKDLYENNLNLCYARYHGKVVEFMKSKKDGLVWE